MGVQHAESLATRSVISVPVLKMLFSSFANFQASDSNQMEVILKYCFRIETLYDIHLMHFECFDTDLWHLWKDQTSTMS